MNSLPSTSWMTEAAPTTLAPASSGNHLLDSLPPEELHQLLPLCEKVAPSQGQEIHRQDGPLPHVYFPISGMISSVVRLKEGREIEASTIGNEGMVGVAASQGLDFSPITNTQLIPGESWRLPTPVLVQALKQGGALEQLLKRYAAFLLRTSNQSVACNVLHSVESRMCRWLLTSQDRVGSSSFLMTHETLAEILGVRRQTITGIAGTMQNAGHLSYRRGHVQILNREGLLACTCECYDVMRSFYERIMQVSANGNGKPSNV